MENKKRNFLFEVKEFNEDEMTFEGYGSVFGNVDAYNDVVVEGAFAKTIKEKKGKIKILWQHKPDYPIGVIEEAKEDNTGLWIKAKLVSGVEKADEAYKLLKAGVLDELSIGFDIIKDEYDRKKGIRYLKEIRLWEISIVSFAANSLAQVTSVKSLFEKINYKKDLFEELEDQELTEERWRIDDAFYDVIYGLINNDDLTSDEKITEFETSLQQYAELISAWFSQMVNTGKSLSTKPETADISLSINDKKSLEGTIDALKSLLDNFEPDDSTRKKSGADKGDKKDKDTEPDNHSDDDKNKDKDKEIADLIEDMKVYLD